MSCFLLYVPKTDHYIINRFPLFVYLLRRLSSPSRQSLFHEWFTSTCTVQMALWMATQSTHCPTLMSATSHRAPRRPPRSLPESPCAGQSDSPNLDPRYPFKSLSTAAPKVVWSFQKLKIFLKMTWDLSLVVNYVHSSVSSLLILKLFVSLFFRYKDYRDPPWDPDAYTFSKQYWSVLAAKLAFVIFFQVWK